MKLRTLFLSLILALSGTLLSEESVQEQTRHFSLEGEWLFFKTVTDQTAFINSLDEIGNTAIGVSTKKISNRPNYKSGFRVEGDLFFCDCAHQLQLRYTHVFNKHKKVVTGIINDVLFGPNASFAPAGGAVGNGTSKLSTTYNAGDIVWERTVFDACDFSLDFLAGLHLTWFKYREDVVRNSFGIAPSTFSWLWENLFRGLGPELGVTFDYRLPCLKALSIRGDARGVLLAGKTSARSLFLASTPVFGRFKIKNDPDGWEIFPGFDVRLGLNYFWSFCYFDVGIEAGYEMLWYSNIVRKDLFGFSTPSEVGTFEFYSDLSLHGPYAAFRVTF